MVNDAISEIAWEWYSFEQLSNRHLHEILRLRQEVFIVEQNCVYLDADELDTVSHHLMGRISGEIVVYARLCPPGSRFTEPSMGRLLTVKPYRQAGLAHRAVERCLLKAKEIFDESSFRISAQSYLRDFYSGFGFVESGEPYDEDGIEHIDMVLKLKAKKR